MWSSTLTDGLTRTLAALCPVWLALAGCSQPAATQPDAAPATNAARPVAAQPAAAEPAATQPVASPSPSATAVPAAAAPAAGSRVLRTTDMALRGKPACKIAYAYAGHDPDTVIWEEPCKAVTAKMMARSELQALGKWERLDEFARKFVAAMPGGRVLYVEGGFSASVYPIGTTGSAYEVAVTD